MHDVDDNSSREYLARRLYAGCRRQRVRGDYPEGPDGIRRLPIIMTKGRDQCNLLFSAVRIALYTPAKTGRPYRQAPRRKVIDLRRAQKHISKCDVCVEIVWQAKIRK